MLIDQPRSLTGTKVADDESLAETLKDEHVYPEVIPLQQPERSQIETSDAQADESQMPQSSQEPRIEEPTKTPVAKHYPGRVHTKPK
jgi:hypothetical protein